MERGPYPLGKFLKLRIYFRLFKKKIRLAFFLKFRVRQSDGRLDISIWIAVQLYWITFLESTGDF